MRGFIIAIVLVALVNQAYQQLHIPLQQLLEQKARLTKTAVDGSLITPVLKSHGTGLTDGQETLIMNYVNQALQLHKTDIFSNAEFIRNKV